MRNPRPWGLTPATDGTWYGHFDAVPAGWDYRPRRDMPWLHDGDGSDDVHPLMGEQIVQCRPPEVPRVVLEAAQVLRDALNHNVAHSSSVVAAQALRTAGLLREPDQ